MRIKTMKASDNFTIEQQIQTVQDCWLKVFPNSSASGRVILRDAGYRLHLVKNSSECPNRILGNDPFSYSSTIDSEGTWSEYRVNLLIAPTDSYHAYSSAKLRRKTIKNVTPEKLIKRFEQVKQFIVENKDNMINLSFNIDSKL